MVGCRGGGGRGGGGACKIAGLASWQLWVADRKDLCPSPPIVGLCVIYTLQLYLSHVIFCSI